MKVWELLQSFGWTQGYYARDAEGRKTTIRDPATACVCLLGAVQKCYRPNPYRTDEYWAVLDRIADELGGLRAARWNDAPGRTKEEVIALCKKLDI